MEAAYTDSWVSFYAFDLTLTIAIFVFADQPGSCLSLCLSMLLSTLETTIVSTSLVSMVNELHGFNQAGWVVTAYFLTYTGQWSPDDP